MNQGMLKRAWASGLSDGENMKTENNPYEDYELAKQYRLGFLTGVENREKEIKMSKPDFEYTKLNFCYLSEDDLDDINRQVGAIGFDLDKCVYLIKPSNLRHYVNYVIQRYNENCRLEEEGII